MTEEEFKETVMPHHTVMMAEALRVLRDRDEALDCLQDALTSLWKSRNSLRGVANVGGYCVRTVSNRALEMIRSRKDIQPDTGDNLSGSDTPVTEMERTEKVSMLRQAVKLLPENERKVIVLKAIKGLTGEEIAEATGLSIANVRVLLHRGRKRLREYMENFY